MKRNRKYLVLSLLFLLITGGAIGFLWRYWHIIPRHSATASSGASTSSSATQYLVQTNQNGKVVTIRIDKNSAVVIDTVATNAVRLSGRVVDEAGNPKEGVLVAFPLGFCKTDNDGKFCFDNMLPLLGEGRDRGKFNMAVPELAWHFVKHLDSIPSGTEQAMNLGNIRLPSPNGSVKGHVSGDQEVLPQTLTMISEDGSIIGFVGIQKDLIEQDSYPAGNYTISNCNLAGHPEPTNALPQSYRIVLRKGEVTEVDFHVSRNSVTSK